MGRLDGKVAIISGAARGQGEAEARLFAAEGAQVVLGDVLDGEGHAVAESLEGAGLYVHLDVTSEEQWAAAVQTALDDYGRVDVLVNNAGIFKRGDLRHTTLDDYRLVVDVNQVGVFLGMKAVAPVMVEQRSGSIVNISSVAGMQGSGGAIAYGATKWAVRGMTKTAAQELGRHGVRCNSIHPGIIQTPMLDLLGDASRRERMQRRIPLGREAEAAEVAALALFLASDESGYCTGTEFVIDGGMTA